jgi:oligopeptidase A
VNATDNPLLALPRPLPFDRVRAEHVVPGIRALIEKAKERLDEVIRMPGPRTWENTMGALDTLTEPLDEGMGLVSHLESVATEPALREAYSAVQPEVSAFYSSIALSERLWNALKAFAATDEAKALTGPRKRYLEKTLADFRRAGADLPPEGKKRLEAIDVELAEVTLKFSQNTLDSTGAFELLIDDPVKLAGLPKSAVDAARQSAEKAGKQGFRFSLQAPSYIPVMTYLEDRSIRETLYRAYNTRATSGDRDNRPLVRRILQLRREKAKLLGYPHFADLVLEDRMAKSGEAARKFVANLRDKTETFFRKENDDLLAFRRELEGANAPPLMPWDVSFYAEKLRRSRYDLDEEELRPYFVADRVLDGLFQIASRLYGIRIVSDPSAPVWHESVRAHSIVDDDGTPLGGFYVDLYPRTTKRDGAWMHGLLTGYGSRPAALEVVVANVTPPVGNRPALLTHAEVETLFHEFGHMLHHALSRVELRSLAGTNVAWDFVELPSQIMENWAWEREALDLFARHVDSGETLPDALLEKMTRAKAFRAANQQMRQLGFAEVDLALHIDLDPTGKEDPLDVGRAILQRYSAVPLPDEHAMLASFGHLFGDSVGYAAGYYSYKWAEVLEADAFGRFKEEGIFRREVGARFRDAILSRGDSDDPAELFRQFRGRDPRLEPLLERFGLVHPAG